MIKKVEREIEKRGLPIRARKARGGVELSCLFAKFEDDVIAPVVFQEHHAFISAKCRWPDWLSGLMKWNDDETDEPDCDMSEYFVPANRKTYNRIYVKNDAYPEKIVDDYIKICSRFLPAWAEHDRQAQMLTDEEFRDSIVSPKDVGEIIAALNQTQLVS